MKNKILSLLMVATMAVGMLAGCGSKTNAPADNQVKEETPATEATAEPATEEAAYLILFCNTPRSPSKYFLHSGRIT